jgi:uridine kinase
MFCGLALGYLALVSPYLLSLGFAQLVLRASEQLRIFNLAVWFSPALAFFVVPAFFLYIMFKMYSFKRINRDVFFLMTGLVFTMLVTLIAPEQGWYLWSIPFIVYFFIKEEGMNRTIYHAFGVAYLAYFAIIPTSDFFKVFQVASKSVSALPNPYAVLSGYTAHADVVVGLAFTALTATLIYLYYIIYKHGIRSSLRLQEKNGVPAIGIAGDSGAGKTTLALLLTRMFGNGRTNIIFGDDVHKWERGHPNWRKYTHLNPVANYINYNYSQIRDLKKGRTIMRPMYDHETGKFTMPKRIAPREMIISEGLHTFFIPESSSIYELKIYLAPTESLRRQWKISRDVKNRNYTEKKVAEQIERRKEDSEKFVQRQREHADLIISFFSVGGHIRLALHIRTSFAMDSFTAAFSECPELELRHEYISTEFQMIMVAGTAEVASITSALARSGVLLDDYRLDENGFAPGLNGVVQAAIAYCLNEKLKTLSASE